MAPNGLKLCSSTFLRSLRGEDVLELPRLHSANLGKGAQALRLGERGRRPAYDDRLNKVASRPYRREETGTSSRCRPAFASRKVWVWTPFRRGQ
jgi:hypothetical protein